MCIQVYASVAAKLRDKSSGCTASVHDGWMGLVETCGHYGIMLHDFLLTLNRPKDQTTTTKYTHCILYIELYNAATEKNGSKD